MREADSAATPAASDTSSEAAASTEAPEAAATAPQQTSAGVRVDKWLWAARMFKTRSAASTACSAGHVKIAGESIKASKVVRPGDRLDVLTPGGPRILEVVALGDRRGPAEAARKLYVDHTPPPPPKDELAGVGMRERGLGRPEKKDRRELRKLRGY